MAAPPTAATQRFRADLEALTGGTPERLGVAVSGGPDSLALLLLAGAALPGRVRAATVDHGLRPEAAAEAELVASVCADLGVPHAILRAEVAAEASLQQAARRARYAALAGWAEAEGIAWIATAHHLDDQAETLVMRLLRGSGAAGLAGIRRTGPMPVAGARARLVRPLLGWRRDELAEIVDRAGLTPIADPSNLDERYDRARVRRRLAEAPWLDPLPLARSAEALGEAEEALAWTAERIGAERIGREGDARTLDRSGLPPELVRRLVLTILAELSPGPAPRGEALGRLIAALGSGGTATLAGVRATGGERWTFAAAAPRAERRSAEP